MNNSLEKNLEFDENMPNTLFIEKQNTVSQQNPIQQLNESKTAETENEKCQENNMEMEEFENSNVVLMTEAKNLIITKVSEDITVNILKEKNTETEQQIQYFKNNESNILELNTDLEMKISCDKSCFLQLESNMMNTGEIIAILQENIKKIEERFENLNTSELLEKITNDKSKLTKMIETFEEKIKNKKNEIDQLKIEQLNEMEEIKKQNLTMENVIKEISFNKEELVEKNNELNDIIAKQEEKIRLLSIEKLELINNPDLSFIDEGNENLDFITNQRNNCQQIFISLKVKFNEMEEENTIVKNLIKTTQNEIKSVEEKQNINRQLFESKTLENQQKAEENCNILREIESTYNLLVMENDKLSNEINDLKKIYKEKLDKKNKLLSDVSVKEDLVKGMEIKLLHLKNDMCLKQNKLQEHYQCQSETEIMAKLQENLSKKLETLMKIKEDYVLKYEELKKNTENLKKYINEIVETIKNDKQDMENTKTAIQIKQDDYEKLKIKSNKLKVSCSKIRVQSKRNETPVKSEAKIRKQSDRSPIRNNKEEQNEMKKLKSGLKSPGKSPNNMEKKVTFNDKLSFKSPSNSTISTEDSQKTSQDLFETLKRY